MAISSKEQLIKRAFTPVEWSLLVKDREFIEAVERAELPRDALEVIGLGTQILSSMPRSRPPCSSSNDS